MKITLAINHQVRSARPTCTSISAALSAAIMFGDMHLATQLAWRLIFQPACPLPTQAYAVLVHSALSIRLGASAELVERNLRATIDRLSSDADARAPQKYRRTLPAAKWRVEILAQLHSALRSLRLHGDIPFRVQRIQRASPTPTRTRAGAGVASAGSEAEESVPDHVVEWMSKMDLHKTVPSSAQILGQVQDMEE